MRCVQVTAPRTGGAIASRAMVAENLLTRLRGLLGRPPLRAGEGMLITRCNAVHMWGMTYAIDVALLDSEGVIVAMYEALPPGSKTDRHRQARYALEVPARTFTAAGLRVGDSLRWSANCAGGEAPSGKLLESGA